MVTATLLTLCLAACQKPIEVGIPAPPTERLVCAKMPLPPDISPLMPFMAPEATSVYQKQQVDERDAKLAAWIIALRDAHFSCYDNLAWVRDYYQSQD